MTALPTLPTPDQAFEQYRPLVENNEQAEAMLLFSGDRTGLAVLQINPEHGLQPVLAVALPDLALNLGTARWILLSTEAYVKISDDEEEAESLSGTLSQRAAQGDPTVKDCVRITAVAAGGQRYDYMRTFTRTQVGVVWDAPEIWHDAQGGVIDMLLHAVR